MLLVTGMGLPDSDGELDAYVARLIERARRGGGIRRGRHATTSRPGSSPRPDDEDCPGRHPVAHPSSP